MRRRARRNRDRQVTKNKRDAAESIPGRLVPPILVPTVFPILVRVVPSILPLLVLPILVPLLVPQILVPLLALPETSPPGKPRKPSVFKTSSPRIAYTTNKLGIARA